tara:strand:+ start:703 stop:2202 length:1500 start_codon:yes stop_codon:yes gene_type:complete
MARVGESIDARLLRLDPQVFRSIESAGASTGAMYTNLGSNVSDALSGYRKAKEGRSAFALDAIADKHTKILTLGDPGYDPNLPGKTGFDKTEFIKEAKAGRISLKVITEVLNQHEKETEVKNKAYVDTTLKQEQLAATQDIAQTGAERLLEAQKLTGVTAGWQQDMLAQSKTEADETKAEKVSNKAKSSLIFGQADALLEQLKLVPVGERAALRQTYTTLASVLLNYGESGRAMFDQLTVRSKGIIDARELKKATQAEEVRKQTEKAAGVHFESFRKDLLKFQETLDPEKRGILRNKLTADYSFAKYGAAGQHFSNEYNTVLTGLYSLANPTLRTKPEEFVDLARTIEEFSLIGDGPVSLTTDGRIDMNKVKKWYDTFPEKLRLALATPEDEGSPALIKTTFPDEAVRTTVQNFVNTYTSFQGTARTLGGVAPAQQIAEELKARAWMAYGNMTPAERERLRPSSGRGFHSSANRKELRTRIGHDIFDFLENQIVSGLLK